MLRASFLFGGDLHLSTSVPQQQGENRLGGTSRKPLKYLTLHFPPPPHDYCCAPVAPLVSIVGHPSYRSHDCVAASYLPLAHSCTSLRLGYSCTHLPLPIFTATDGRCDHPSSSRTVIAGRCCRGDVEVPPVWPFVPLLILWLRRTKPEPNFLARTRTLDTPPLTQGLDTARAKWWSHGSVGA